MIKITLEIYANNDISTEQIALDIGKIGWAKTIKNIRTETDENLF